MSTDFRYPSGAGGQGDCRWPQSDSERRPKTSNNKAQGAPDLQNLLQQPDVLVGRCQRTYAVRHYAMGMPYSQNAFVAIVSRNPHGGNGPSGRWAITPVVGPGSGHPVYPSEGGEPRSEAGAER